MTTKQALTEINKAYWKLERCCESTHEWDSYVKLVSEAERGHRRFKPDHVQCGLTISQSVRLFAVKEVFERFVPAHSSEKIYTPQAVDFFHIRQDVFAACAIADLCKEKILAAHTLAEMRLWLDTIDYAELNKDRRIAA